ncbi:uncharacterized protein LOC121801894 [Salvia splendens]|uniref:uncharacterized protein LOC121801894 n=1 Tax=Salvia splendens TaxID=180675 RepID=UPI001C25FE8D|nr:uncharacterized protein LOC121801894 [Salvia splendens]XP_042057284.1 uncharacterized protein LOC121801894 [Salvia splendens]XP_042057285.1 uncharacterized protein LOC121801894 [Salvia splendens]XP_042057286.1 uncharacterized protein LOC121801894 [Salvia splendens]XP_042057287.1 uncharacterized protein LOC121801894 [Salvia splendens]XP_042057288.1 uncharacterized protein LOC121801894 [Salvia splendens]
MDRNTFGKLCRILKDRGGLHIGKCLGIEEQVAMFLGVLAHHKKNRIVRFNFVRSGSTISYYVNKVLGAVLSLHDVLFEKPTPVLDNCIDHRWKWFEGCLDGTHVNVLVSNSDKPRYRTQKGSIATNTLAVCDRNMQFVYILGGKDLQGIQECRGTPYLGPMGSESRRVVTISVTAHTLIATTS